MQEKVILTSPTCPGCQELKKHLKRLGIEGNFRFLDVTTEEGTVIAKKLGITHVPDCIIIETNDQGRRARVCTQDEFLRWLQKK